MVVFEQREHCYFHTFPLPRSLLPPPPPTTVAVVTASGDKVNWTNERMRVTNHFRSRASLD